MITATSRTENYLTDVTDGTLSALIDAPASKGGQDAGLNPFALLEASVAACLNITMRVYAQNHGFALHDVQTTAAIKRNDDGFYFEYSVKLPDGLSDDQTKRLLAACKGCPVHAVFKQAVPFVHKDGE